jgi:phosphoglycolate phosphatase-like HAD superfamily hydrolase
MSKLVLFDIDGTLLWPNGAGGLAMERALAEVYGTSGVLHQISMVGATDHSIVHQALTGAGLAPGDIQDRWEPFTLALERHMSTAVLERQPTLCPGVPSLLDALAAHDDVLLGLVTGNLETTAPIKLQAVGIDAGLFRVGGFGSDHSDRTKLPAIAARRAEALTGQRFQGHSKIVIGDTPADVASGRAVGARTVAVATGLSPIEALQAAHPDELLPDFSDLERALAAIVPC